MFTCTGMLQVSAKSTMNIVAKHKAVIMAIVFCNKIKHRYSYRKWSPMERVIDYISALTSLKYGPIQYGNPKNNDNKVQEHIMNRFQFAVVKSLNSCWLLMAQIRVIWTDDRL